MASVQRETVERPIPGEAGGVTLDSVTTDSVSTDPDTPSGPTQSFETAVAAIGTPTLWFRFDEASGNIINQGTQAGADMVPTTFGEAFNGTYQQAGFIPSEGGGFPASGTGAMEFNAGGNLTCSQDWNGSYGTIFMVVRTDTQSSTAGQWTWAVSRGFDLDAVSMILNSNTGNITVAKQNGFTNDRSRTGLTALLTPMSGNVQSLAIRQNNDANDVDIYANAVENTSYSDITNNPPPADYWFDSYNPTTCVIGSRGGVSSTQKTEVTIDEFLYYEDRELTTEEIESLHNNITGEDAGGATPEVSMSDTNISIDDGDSISTSLSVSGDWNDGNADSSLEFVTTHWSTSTSGSTAPTFPGGTWSTIGSFGSFMGWDDGTEQPPDGAYVYTNDVIANLVDPFQDDGGGNWVRMEVTAIGPGGTSSAFEFFFKDAGF